MSPPVRAARAWKVTVDTTMEHRPDRALAARIFREEAEREGFARCGIARAGTPHGFDRFRAWIAGGLQAGMGYMEETMEARSDPDRILPGARSVVCLAAPHPAGPSRASDGTTIARYAAGTDYHRTLREGALRVAEASRRRVGIPFSWRVCVDSTPLAERSFAAAAGVGWIGKNGCLIDPVLGSFFLLAEIVTDLDLPPDDPIAERCGSCVRCLDECPTGAIVEPGIVDANRCLAYWTIEHRGEIPPSIAEAVGDRVFGCDDCQDACPWNAPLHDLCGAAAPTRAEWLAQGRGEFRRRYGATALNRAGWRGLQRNAAIAAGCAGDPSVRTPLTRAAGTGDRGLSAAALWALGRIPTRADGDEAQ